MYNKTSEYGKQNFVHKIVESNAIGKQNYDSLEKKRIRREKEEKRKEKK